MHVRMLCMYVCFHNERFEQFFNGFCENIAQKPHKI